jgi:hypothetical protein
VEREKSRGEGGEVEVNEGEEVKEEKRKRMSERGWNREKVKFFF